MLDYQLTKSKYVLGIQCEKALWLDVHTPQHAAGVGTAQRRLMEQGIAVGKMARERFPDGELVPPAYSNLEHAVRATQDALANEQSIYEAAFLHDQTLVVVDILERTQAGWHLIEVKASTEVKKHYLHDVAVQRHVLERNGLKVAKTSLMLVNTDATYPDLTDFFQLHDVTDQLSEVADPGSMLENFHAVLDQDSEPDILIGRHCKKPHECPFMGYCWEPYKKRTIFHVENLYWRTQDQLRSDGYIRVEDVPSDYPLKDKYWPRIELLRDRGEQVDRAAIQRELNRLEHPIHFLDFETDNPAIPRFEGTHSFQHVPFQYSLHILQEHGELEHREYLHTDVSDPRGPLAAHLAADLEPVGSIVVWSAGFERRVLKQLAERFDEHADRFSEAAKRLWDQLDIFRKDYKHHAFGGSNSIKSVLPVLVPELGYKELDVQDGSQAQAAWDRIMNREPEWQQEAEALREYCRVDTLAMVEIHRHLVAITQGSIDQGM